MKLNLENNDQKLRIYLELSNQEIKLYKKWMVGIFSVSIPVLLSYPSWVKIIIPSPESLPPQKQIIDLSQEDTKN